MNDEFTGKAKGGKALAEKMTPDERKAKSMAMVEAKKARQAMIKASHRGEIKIGNIDIPCAVLEDGTRVISEMGIHSHLGSSGGKVRQIRAEMEERTGAPVPLFLASKALEPFIHEVFDGGHPSPIEYVNNGVISRGYPASILPKVCEVWLKASDAGTLQESQLPKVKKAEVLMRGLAHIGIIALVDEATGYQRDREKDALAKILEAFVAKELQPYLRTFPPEYYENLFRIYGYEYPPKDKRPQWRPVYFGNITNNVVYERIAPELLSELKKSASKIERKTKLHQWLTSDIGHPKLKEHLASIVTLLKLSNSPQEFKSMVDKIHPRFGTNLEIDFNAPDS